MSEPPRTPLKLRRRPRQLEAQRLSPQQCQCGKDHATLAFLEICLLESSFRGTPAGAGSQTGLLCTQTDSMVRSQDGAYQHSHHTSHLKGRSLAQDRRGKGGRRRGLLAHVMVVAGLVCAS